MTTEDDILLDNSVSEIIDLVNVSNEDDLLDDDIILKVEDDKYSNFL